MAKYILLINWTDQGVKSVKDSPKRLDAARKLACWWKLRMTRRSPSSCCFRRVASTSGPKP